MFAVTELASRLIAAHDAARTLAPITDEAADFDIAAAYESWPRSSAAAVRRAGCPWDARSASPTARYGRATACSSRCGRTRGRTRCSTRAMAMRRRHWPPSCSRASSPRSCSACAAPCPTTGDAEEILRHVEWIAAGFEIVQSHFPGWKFKAPDCTAAFGLHGALVVGTPVPVTEANRAGFAAALPTFELTLRRGRGDRPWPRQQRSGQPGIGVGASRPGPVRPAAVPGPRRGRDRDVRDGHRRVAGRARRNVVERLRQSGFAGHPPRPDLTGRAVLGCSSPFPLTGMISHPAGAGSARRRLERKEGLE